MYRSTDPVPVTSMNRISTIKIHGPALILAAYTTVPFYKNSVQGSFPVDVTVLLAVISTAVAIPGVLRAIFNDSIQRVNQNRSLLSWLALGCLVWMGTLYSADTNMALDAALSFSALVLLPLLVSLSVSGSAESIAQFLWILFLTGVAMTTVAVTSGVAAGDYGRLIVGGVNPINVAIATLFVPAIGFTFVWGRSAHLRPLVIGLSILALIVSASSARGPLIAGGITLLILLAMRSRYPFVLIFAFGGAIALMFAFGGSIAQLILSESAAHRFELLGSSLKDILFSDSEGVQDTSVATREELYRLALEMFERAPLFGGGTASFEQEISSFPWLWDLTYPHNLVLQFAAEYGVVGLTLLAWVTFGACRALNSHLHDPVWAAIGTLYLVVVFAAMFSGGLDNRLLWAMTFMLLAASPTLDTMPHTRDLRSMGRLLVTRDNKR